MTKKEMQEMMAQMQAQMQAQAELIDKLTAQAATQTSARKASPKLVDFTKADGTVVKCTAAQAAAWGKFRDASGERKAAFEEMKAGWATKREAYKPSKALVDAIKKDRASITRKIAKEQYGFVGTKDDLKALKDSICK